MSPQKCWECWMLTSNMNYTPCRVYGHCSYGKYCYATRGLIVWSNLSDIWSYHLYDQFYWTTTQWAIYPAWSALARYIAAPTWWANFMRQMKKDAFVIGGGISLDPTEISYGTQWNSGSGRQRSDQWGPEGGPAAASMCCQCHTYPGLCCGLNGLVS